MFEASDLLNLIVLIIGAWIAYTVRRLDKNNEKLWVRLDEIIDNMVAPKTLEAKHAQHFAEVKTLLVPLIGVPKTVKELEHRVTVMETLGQVQGQ